MGLEGNAFLCMSELSRYVTMGMVTSASKNVCWSSAGPGCVRCVPISRRRWSERRVKYYEGTQDSWVFSCATDSLLVLGKIILSPVFHQLQKVFGDVMYCHLCPTLPFYSDNPMEQMLILILHSSSQ